MAGTLQVYSYNRCSTCRKALAWLTERAIAHQVHDITLTPPSKEMLVAIRDQGDVDALISELDGLNFSSGVPTPKDQV